MLDREHDWVTIQAPRGQSTDLAPYSDVTDVHGVDVYPVTLRATDPNLHDVGSWTSTMASITPSHSVWTTLQICASGSYDTSTDEFVLPTRVQERYMIYDAIINGARMLAFFGGNNPQCWNAADADHAWSWTFWNTVLKGLIGEIDAISPLAPALVNVGTTQALHSSDATTQVISRAGNTNDLWVMAARGGTGTASVTIDGIPPTVTSGTVYTEGRSVPVANGSFTDTFDRWGVHVYHFVVPGAAAVGAADDLVVRADLGRGRDARHDCGNESRRRDLRHLRRFERRLHAGLADRADRDRAGRGDDWVDRGHDAGWDGDELLCVHGHRAGAAVRVAEPGRQLGRAGRAGSGSSAADNGVDGADGTRAHCSRTRRRPTDDARARDVARRPARRHATTRHAARSRRRRHDPRSRGRRPARRRRGERHPRRRQGARPALRPHGQRRAQRPRRRARPRLVRQRT